MKGFKEFLNVLWFLLKVFRRYQRNTRKGFCKKMLEKLAENRPGKEPQKIAVCELFTGHEQQMLQALEILEGLGNCWVNDLAIEYLDCAISQLKDAFEHPAALLIAESCLDSFCRLKLPPKEWGWFLPMKEVLEEVFSLLHVPKLVAHYDRCYEQVALIHSNLKKTSEKCRVVDLNEDLRQAEKELAVFEKYLLKVHADKIQHIHYFAAKEV